MTIKFVKMEAFGGPNWNCSNGVVTVKVQLSEFKKKMGEVTMNVKNYFED